MQNIAKNKYHTGEVCSKNCRLQLRSLTCGPKDSQLRELLNALELASETAWFSR